MQEIPVGLEKAGRPGSIPQCTNLLISVNAKQHSVKINTGDVVNKISSKDAMAELKGLWGNTEEH